MTFRSKHSLRSKIFLRFTLIVGLTLITTGICSLLIARRAFEERASLELLSLAQDRAQSALSLMENQRSIARLLAADSRMTDFLRESSAAVRPYLLQKKPLFPDLQSAMLLDRNGNVRVATDSAREGEVLTDFLPFVYGLQGTYLGKWDIGRGQRSHVIATPIRGNDGELLGVLIAEFDLKSFYDLFLHGWSAAGMIQELLVEPSLSGAFCFNPRDIIFSRESAIPSPKKSQSFLSAFRTGSGFLPFSGTLGGFCDIAAGGREGILSGLDAEGDQSIAAHRFLPELGLGIIVKLETSEVFRPVTLLLSVLMGATALSLFVVAFIALRLSRDITTPILSLKESLGKLDTGHWTHKRSIFTGDELEVLDKEASRLAVRLEEAYSSLEKKVEERTRELAEDQAKDEALLESIGDGVIATDLTGKVVACNHAAELLLKWEREEMLKGHFGSSLVLRSREKTLIPPHEHFVQTALDQKATVRSTPHRTYYCERKDGTTFPIALTATPFLLGMEMRGVVVTFRDISEEKKVDRMKSEFVSLASHQLRTPLTAVGWYIELLQKEAAPLLHEDQKEYLTQIVSSHQRMVTLVNDLLNVSRIELGRLTVEPEHTDLRMLVDQIVNELSPQIQEKKLKFAKRLPEKLQAFVDPRLVQMVLENLLSNAIKYTPVGGLIELAMVLGGQEVRFEVRDTGYGIPASQQHRVFEKLFRADNIAKTDTVGTGIGLYIASSSTEAWGGRLWFESEEGHGTTFYFTVPLEMQNIGGGDRPPLTGGIGGGSSSPH